MTSHVLSSGKGIYQQKDWICRGLFMPCDNSGASQHMYIFFILWIFQEKFRRMPWTGAPFLCLLPSGETVWKSETIKALFGEGAVCLSPDPWSPFVTGNQHYQILHPHPRDSELSVLGEQRLCFYKHPGCSAQPDLGNTGIDDRKLPWEEIIWN